MESILLSFYDVNIQSAELAASKLRKVTSTERLKSEIFLIIELGQQKVEFDIEEPQGANKKCPNNTFFLYRYKSEGRPAIKFTLEERVFKLERDEEALME